MKNEKPYILVRRTPKQNLMEAICRIDNENLVFQTNGESVSIRLDDILTVKPASMNKTNPFTGDVEFRNFPRLSIITKDNKIDIAYPSFQIRDIEYERVLSALKNYQPENKILTNVAEAKRLLYHIKKETGKYAFVNKAVRSDIVDCTEDIKERMESNERIPIYILNCLSRLACEVPPVAEYVFLLRQLLG